MRHSTSTTATHCDQTTLAKPIRHARGDRPAGRRGRKRTNVVDSMVPAAAMPATDITIDAGGSAEDDRRKPSVEPPYSGVDDPVRQYLQSIGKTELLTAAEEIQLTQAMEAGALATQQLNDVEMVLDDETRLALTELVDAGIAARTRMVNANLRLVVSIVKKYQGRGLPFLDLVQEGNIGLLRAVGKFNWRKGHKFSTMATWWIRQAVTRALADKSRTIRLPVHVNDTISAIARTEKQLQQALQRDPTLEELATATGMPVAKLRDQLEASRRPKSLNQAVGEDGDGEFGDFIEDDRLMSPEAATNHTLLREAIHEALDKLTPRERKVIKLRYGLEDGQHRTLDQVGQKFGLTRERIRQIEAVALRKLRHPSFGRTLRAYVE